MHQLILTAIGPDHPGLVGQLTGHLHEAGANIIESRMVNLRGQFAILMLVEGNSDAVGTIQRSAGEVGTRLGLRVACHAVELASGPAVAGVPMELKTYSLDQPGLVHAITDVLRRHQVNIEDLTAKQESAPFAGTPLFTIHARLTVPAAVPIRQLRAELESACQKLNCDLDLGPLRGNA